ncbi:MAG TPA: glycosyltransferase [Bacteroidales bacterium]|nr:glycosyltransferase [Bacteroidales bacterium]
MKITILGLSITSSWGNGHATTFRSLVKGLNKRGHSVSFLERDVPWYASNRDLPDPDYCKVYLYKSLADLQQNYGGKVSNADLVIVGSYVPEGVAVAEFVMKSAHGIKAFYDIDTPVTFAKLEKKDYEYITPALIPQFDLYLTFSGGRTIEIFSTILGSRNVRPFYCSVDSDLYYPDCFDKTWDLGYLGTYSADRQPALDKLMIQAAKRWRKGKFIVAGPQFPADTKWPRNIRYIHHLAPVLHRKFYNKQRFTLNITRQDMVRMGHSPSVRLFEAAACGVPIISDYWEGLESFFEPGKEIFISELPEDTIEILKEAPESLIKTIAKNARSKILQSHTGVQRAIELENYVFELTHKYALKISALGKDYMQDKTRI